MSMNDLSGYIKYLVLAALIYMPVFGHLNRQPIRVWDESRNAINAIEMMDNGNWLVTHFKGEPDHWYTKPPLVVWCQTALMQSFGINELSVRLPSAIAAFLTILSLILFSALHLRIPWLGVIGTMILITSHGYISIHGTRTGDTDSMLTLFTTVSLIMAYLFVERSKIKYLYLFFIFSALAVLTKSVAGLLFMPGLAIFLVYRGKLWSTIKEPRSYLGFLLFLIPIVGYYFLRENADPGYLNSVWLNELGGRYLDTIEGHKQPFEFYFLRLSRQRFTNWFVLIPIAFVVLFLLKDKRLKDFGTFCFLLALSYFLVISFSQTKLVWYDIPLYPLLALFTAIPVYKLFEKIKDSLTKDVGKTQLVKLLPAAFLIAVFMAPYSHIWKKTYIPGEVVHDWETYSISYYLKRSVEGIYDMNLIHHLHENYDAHILFYHRVLRDQGKEIWVNQPDKIKVGDRVLVHQDNTKAFVDQRFETEKLFTYRHVDELKITGIK